MGNYNQNKEDMESNRPYFHVYKKLKQRVKKGLFDFFKDEIINVTFPLRINPPTVCIPSEHITPILIEGEYEILPTHSHAPKEKIINYLKHSFFDECMKHINIETKYDKFDYQRSRPKVIRISMYVLPKRDEKLAI